MTVGFHSPLPPARTGIADYAARLLDELRKLGRVETNAATADVHLYHLGNNQLHRAIYERAMSQPGVVVLHDAVLQHFYLGAFDEERYVEEFVYNYGDWERGLAHQLYRERAGSGMDLRYYARPMLKRVAERSLAVIVHNPAAARLVAEHAPHARIVEIPHFFDCPYPPNEAAGFRLRQNWDADSGDCVFGVFGYLRESKRVIPALQCFERLHAVLPRTRLLLAGAFASADLARAVAPFQSRPGVVRSGHLAERAFWQVAGAVDCCLNLRYPGAGETSGIGIRLMGLGKTVFFTDGDEIGRFPAAGCIRVSPGLEESSELFEYMNIAARRPDFTRAIGERAAAYIREYHAIDRVAGEYWNTLCAIRDTLR